MAQVSIAVPQDFMRNMSQFMANVQKMQQLVNKLNYTTTNQISVNQLYVASSSSKNQFNRMLQIFRKLSASMQSSIAMIMRAMGSVGQVFLRGLSLLSATLGPIISLTVSTVALIGGVAIGAATSAASLMRWLWDKMIGLGDSMLQDFLQSSGSFSSIAGLRAWRSTFGQILNDPNVLTNTAQARGSQVSRQFLALKFLGIKRYKDTADMMVDATIAASHFIKAQRAGQELMMAEAIGLTSIFNPETLMKLKEIDEDELLAIKKLYDSYKPLMQITDKAREGWIRFTLTVKATGVQIASIIAEKLADPSAPFTQAVQNLSKAVVNFIKKFMDSPLLQEFIAVESGKTMIEAGYIDRFTAWLKDPKTVEKVETLIVTIKDVIKWIFEAIRHLKEMIRTWGGSIGKTRLDRHVRRPGVGPGQVYPEGGPSYRPGARPGAKHPFSTRPSVRGPADVRGPGVRGPAAPFRSGPRQAQPLAPRTRDSRYPDTSGPGGRQAVSTDYVFEKTQQTTGLPRNVIDAVRSQLQDKESSFRYDLNDQGNRRTSNFGAYQYNEDDVAVAAQYFGERAPSRAELLSNPKLQEKYLEGYWLSRIHQSGLDKDPKFLALREQAAKGDTTAQDRMARILISQQTSTGREALEDRPWPGDRYHGADYWTRGFAQRLAAARGQPAPGTVPAIDGGPANQSDIDYLAAHGGHSMINRQKVPIDSVAVPGLSPLNPEFAARLRAAGELYTKETGRTPRYGELTRDVATQEYYYYLYTHPNVPGGGGIAAPPGRSRHQLGTAADIPSGDFLDWMHANSYRFGLNYPVRGDPVHTQMDPGYRGPQYLRPTTRNVDIPETKGFMEPQKLRSWPLETDQEPSESIPGWLERRLAKQKEDNHTISVTNHGSSNGTEKDDLHNGGSLENGLKVNNHSDYDVKLESDSNIIIPTEKSRPDIVRRPGHSRIPSRQETSVNQPAPQEPPPIDASPTTRQMAGATAIGESETGFRKEEAYTDFYNDPRKFIFKDGKRIKNPGYNANVAKYGERGADYGYFQMNQMDVEDAIKRGMTPEKAQHLMGGGKDGTSTKEEQIDAVREYLTLKYTPYQKLGETGVFEPFRKEASKQWFGLSRDHGKVAKSAYQNLLLSLKSAEESQQASASVAEEPEQELAGAD